MPFGECHNVTPMLTNPVTLEYGFLGAVESSFEVRTNGKPIAVALNDQAGRFNLTTDPFSTTITVSVQGARVADMHRVSRRWCSVLPPPTARRPTV